MHAIIELILNSALLWIFLHTTWIVLVSVLYYFCIPWIVWGALLLAIGLRLARIPPPQSSAVKEVLGINPFYVQNRENSSIDNHGNGEQFCMRVVAHRGAGYDYPENSLTALRNAKKRGCTAAEIDLMLTKDNVPIIFHDFTIERLTGQTGNVRDMTWEQLKKLDITYNHPLRHKFRNGERIALFYDVLEECLENQQRIIIDIKESRMEVVQIVVYAFKMYPKLYKRAVISSFNPVIVYMIRRIEPRIIAALAWRPQFFSRSSYQGLDGLGNVWYNNLFQHLAACALDTIYEWSFSRFIYYIVGISVVLLHKDIVNQRVVQEWHERGVRVMAWTVNLPSEKLHFSRHLRTTYLTDTLVAEKVA